MNWKFTDSTNKVVSRFLASGAQESKIVSEAEVAAFVASGGVIIPADPLPPPTDYSDSTNIDKTLQALMLCIAQVGGLTIPQAKALFKQKFNSLP